MKKNIDPIDRIIRFVIFGFLLSISYAGINLPLWVHGLAFSLAFYFLLTIIFAYSPVYHIFKYSTFQKE